MVTPISITAGYSLSVRIILANSPYFSGAFESALPVALAPNVRHPSRSVLTNPSGGLKRRGGGCDLNIARYQFYGYPHNNYVQKFHPRCIRNDEGIWGSSRVDLANRCNSVHSRLGTLCGYY